ncbi:hypothetical protein Tco_1036547 [Tanacetum coccineum]
MKSKSKVTDKSDSLKSRWIPMSKRPLKEPGDDIVLNAQPVSQYNPITGEVIKESDKAPVVKEKPADVIEKSTVVKSTVVKEKLVDVIKKSAVDEKDNPKVTSKVLKYKRKTELPKDNQNDNPKDKESDKAPVVAAVVSDENDKAPVVTPVLKEKPTYVIEKSTVVKESDKVPVVMESGKAPIVKESDKASVFAPVLKEKPANVIEKSTVVNEKEKATVDVTSKVAKDKEKLAVDVTSKVSKSKAVVHKDKALDVVSKDQEKGNPPSVVGKGNALSIVGKAKDKPSVVKGKVPTELPKDKPKPKVNHKDKPKPKDKHKAGKVSEVLVLRSKPEVKAKASVSEGVKRMLSIKDRSKKKIELKMIKGKMVSDEVVSDEVDIETGDYVEVTPSKIHDILSIPVGGILLFLLDVRPIEHEFVRSWVVQFYPKSLKEIQVGDIASKVISAQQVDFLFKVNFLTLFTNTMGRVDGLKGQICLDVVRRLHEESVISEINWCGYIHRCLDDIELPGKPIMHYLGPFTFLISLYLDSTKFDRFPVVRTCSAIKDWTSTLMRKRQDLETEEHVIGCLDLHNEWTKSKLQETEGFTKVSSLESSKRAKEKLASICSKRVVLEDLMKKASSDYPGDQKFVELQEKYVQVFRDPISFDVGGNDSDGDDDGDDDDNDDGSNPSFGFIKIGLDDFDKQPSQEGTDAEKESVDPTQEGTVVEGNPAEECEIMSTLENYTQWLERNADLVREIIDAITDEYLYGDLFSDNSSVRMELSNQGPPTKDRMPTRTSNANTSLGKRIVKPSSYLLSPYMNKKTKVVSKITRLEFIIGNNLFAMQGDKM